MVLDALAQHLVLGEQFAEFVQLAGIGQLAPDQQVGGFDKGAALGQILNRVAPVAQDTLVTVNVGDL